MRAAAFIFAGVLMLHASGAIADECEAGSADVLKLVDWTTKAVASSAGPSIEVTLTLENSTDTPIRMIDASIVIEDALGAPIGQRLIDRDFRIGPRGRSDTTFPTTTGDGFARLQRLERRDVEATVCVRAVLSEDGTKQQFSAPAAEPMTIAEIDALRQQIHRCWNPPVGARDADELVVQVRVLLNADGSVEAIPDAEAQGFGPFYDAVADSARRAVLSCQPYDLTASKYEFWRDLRVTLDARELF